MVIWNSALDMNKKILVGLSIAIVVIVGVLFVRASQVSTSSSPTTTTLPPLELNLREGEQAVDLRRIGISISLPLKDIDIPYIPLAISQFELVPTELSEVGALVDFENEVLFDVLSPEDCAHKVEEKMVLTFENETDFTFDNYLANNCVDGLDIFQNFLIFAVVDRDDLPAEFLANLDAMEEFNPSPALANVFDIE